MRFSLEFLKEFGDVKCSVKELANRLTLSGMEVEAIEKQGSDSTVEVEITTNRYDWLSHIGIAREVAVVQGRRAKITYPKVTREAYHGQRKIVIEDSADCAYYVGRIIRGIQVSPSPRWLYRRVVHCGINSINSIVDITNYCMLKWGNPLHAFDEDKLEGDIVIRRAKDGEVFLGLDGKERILNEVNLVIADSKKVVALAGVMGAKNSEVDEATKNVFLEAAYFSPLAVRSSRRAAGIDTESSYRFERMVHPRYLDYASFEAVQLIERICAPSKQKVQRGYLVAGKKPVVKPKQITLDLERMNSFLGVTIPVRTVIAILGNLGFQCKKKGKNTLSVTAPDFRFDISRVEDIYEECIRIYGYDKVPVSRMFLSCSKIGEDIFNFKKEIREFLVVAGLREIITYSVQAEAILQKMEEKGIIALVNPLRQQGNIMRPNGLWGMAEVIRRNMSYGQRALSLFEITHLYRRIKKGKEEVPYVTFGMTVAEEGFFRLKGIITKLMKFLAIEDFRFEDETFSWCTGSQRLIVNGQPAGFLGIISFPFQKMLNLQDRIVYGQCNLSVLLSNRQEVTYSAFSIFPEVTRDISLEMRKGIVFATVREIIRKHGTDIVKDIEVIDTYQGKTLSAGTIAITVRIYYQSFDHTLSADEVEAVHTAIRNCLSQQDGISLR